MEQNNGIKPLSEECSFDKTERTCDYTCFACTFFHGLEKGGKGGLWATTGVPNKYTEVRADNLPFKEDNKKAHDVLQRYLSNILENVQDRNMGLYLYSVPEKDNPLGTGTGKTTGATAIINEYVIQRGKAFLTGEQEMKHNPAIFVRTSELQGQFNAQFREDRQIRETATRRYYKLKTELMNRELVVFDDIATRGSMISEAWEEELYQIIDYRSSMLDKGATIFTANVGMSTLPDLVGHRIASRIGGMSIEIAFRGPDKRKEALLGGN